MGKRLSDEEKARRAAQRRYADALQAEQDAVRFEVREREWEANGTRLTQEEIAAGAACRGCGLPIDDGLGAGVPPIKMTPEQRADYDAANAEYLGRHGDCRAHRWLVGNSRAEHCGYCCPPPPVDPAVLEEVWAIFTRSPRPGPEDLDMWRLTFTCGHVAEKTQHRSNERWTGSTATCGECGQIRGIVETEKLPAGEVRRRADMERLTREWEQAERERDRAQKKADAAARRAGKIQRELDELQKQAVPVGR
ncbi:hypothetical protein [Amycolatopsis sp. NPDC004378]